MINHALYAEGSLKLLSIFYGNALLPWMCGVLGARNYKKKSSTCAANFLQLVEAIFHHCEADEIIQFSGIARRLWLRRNEVVFEGTFVHPSILVQRMSTAVEEFSKANAGEDTLRESNEMAVYEVWRAPCHGWWKVNWDASLGKE